MKLWLLAPKLSLPSTLLIVFVQTGGLNLNLPHVGCNAWTQILPMILKNKEKSHMWRSRSLKFRFSSSWILQMSLVGLSHQQVTVLLAWAACASLTRLSFSPSMSLVFIWFFSPSLGKGEWASGYVGVWLLAGSNAKKTRLTGAHSHASK